MDSGRKTFRPCELVPLLSGFGKCEMRLKKDIPETLNPKSLFLCDREGPLVSLFSEGLGSLPGGRPRLGAVSRHSLSPGAGTLWDYVGCGSC